MIVHALKEHLIAKNKYDTWCGQLLDVKHSDATKYIENVSCKECLAELRANEVADKLRSPNWEDGGAVMSATGDSLNRIAGINNLVRKPGESDAALRLRVVDKIRSKN